MNQELRVANEEREKIMKRRQQVLHDKKWRIVLRRTWLFRYVPFVDFALASGSIAMGNVNENSDFDVLIGARRGRIFTARFIAAVLFGLFGWRRSKMDHGVSAKDKICLNHFITPKTYRLGLEKNEFWKLFYRSFVPMYGDKKGIEDFFVANRDWLPDAGYKEDMRHKHYEPALVGRLIERLLNGRFGNWFEKKVKVFQIRRIERAQGDTLSSVGGSRLPYGEGDKVAEYTLPPFIIYNDNELQFHPNPAHLVVRYK